MFDTRCYVIFAYLIGSDSDLKLVMNDKCDVQVFASRERARKWAIDHMTPDWTWVIVPFEYVEIGD